MNKVGPWTIVVLKDFECGSLAHWSSAKGFGFAPFSAPTGVASLQSLGGSVKRAKGDAQSCEQFSKLKTRNEGPVQ